MLSHAPIKCPQFLLDATKPLRSVPTAIVNAGTRLVLNSARLAMRDDVIEPVLIGNVSNIQSIAREIGWDISKLRIIGADNEVKAANIAVSLARSSEVQTLMKGDIHTDNLLRAVLDRRHGLRTERRLSHVFHMTVPGSDRAIYITDAVINVLPNVDDKMHIILNVVDLCHRLGNVIPKIAILSGSEQVSASMLSSVDAAEITQKAVDIGIKNAVIDGPLAFDNAVSQEAANLKGIDSPVAGIADVLVVPNLESGNFLFKLMVYFMSATAAGLVMGARVPIILTSRADAIESRLASAALAAICVGLKKNKP